MIDHMLQACYFSTENLDTFRPDELKNRESFSLGRAISALENEYDGLARFEDDSLYISNASEPVSYDERVVPVLGITGTGGAGKSSLTDELIRRFLTEFEIGRASCRERV